jgi:non-lysosomal glucosylceramidase
VESEMFEEKKREQSSFRLTRREVLKDGLAAGALLMGGLAPPARGERSDSGPSATTKTLFPTGLPRAEFVDFAAAGFSAPVIGVIHDREYPAVCGAPLGGIGTGCLDLETSGLFGLCSIFNSFSPRRGAMNWPFLGLNINGDTWVLTTGQQSAEAGSGAAADQPRPADLVLPDVKMAKNIRYWGHYPVADLEYETDAPVTVGMRAWSPLIPGDAALSNTPVAVFEVHVRNTSPEPQAGTLGFSFFGPSYDEAWGWKFGRETVTSPVQGVHVTSRRSNYVLGVIGDRKARTGGAMGHSPMVRQRPSPDPAEWAQAWAALGRELPPPVETEPGSTVAVDFHLEAGAQDVVRFVLAWYSPYWMSSGDPAKGPRAFRHMYSTRFPNALAAARLVVDQHESLLRRILSWQQEFYSDTKLPRWLREVLPNSLHGYAEVGLWAAAEEPIGKWCRPEDGLFAMCESPRTCAQMECLPISFFGNMALVYLFPQLALSTLRAEKAYQFENGAPAMIFGGVGAWCEGPELATPSICYQVTLSTTSYVTMVDRYRMLHGDAAFSQEFYPSAKKAIEFMVDLNRGPDGVVSMPDRLVSEWPGVPYETEWLEWGRWVGIVPHVGGLHLATLAMAERMAKEVGDTAFAAQCRLWFESGKATLENKTWLGKYYARYLDPETGECSDDIAACQLDGEVLARLHGLSNVFRSDRVATTIESIKQTCVAATEFGSVLYASSRGKLARGAGSVMHSYPATETFLQVILPLGLMYIYAGQVEFGLEVMRRTFHNNVCRQGLSWYGENSFDTVTGKWRSGTEYITRMFLWNVMAAAAGKDIAACSRDGSLVQRALHAASQETAEISVSKLAGG